MALKFDNTIKRTAKINQQIADEIRRLRKEDGLNYQEIIDIVKASYGVEISSSNIGRIIGNQAWVKQKNVG